MYSRGVDEIVIVLRIIDRYDVDDFWVLLVGCVCGVFFFVCVYA